MRRYGVLNNAHFEFEWPAFAQKTDISWQENDVYKQVSGATLSALVYSFVALIRIHKHDNFFFFFFFRNIR